MLNEREMSIDEDNLRSECEEKYKEEIKQIKADLAATEAERDIYKGAFERILPCPEFRGDAKDYTDKCVTRIVSELDKQITLIAEFRADRDRVVEEAGQLRELLGKADIYINPDYEDQFKLKVEIRAVLDRNYLAAREEVVAGGKPYLVYEHTVCKNCWEQVEVIHMAIDGKILDELVDIDKPIQLIVRPIPEVIPDVDNGQ